MKTGVEIIAEKRAEMPNVIHPFFDAITMFDQARVRRFEHNSRDAYLHYLAYAGALIAAEIDRLNNVKQ